MALLQLPPCPSSLKSIQHYLKTATEHETRDPVIAYWCRLYALQTALKIDKKSDNAKQLLTALLEWLEKQKKALADNESVTNDIAAQAHVENYALKLFFWADGQDRAGVFNKNVVKAFYTAGMLMDVLSTFGETSEEIQNNCKYAKWKAAYIHNCLKNGENPVAGPVGWKADEENNDGESDENINVNQNEDNIPQPFSSNIGFNIPGPSGNHSSPNWQPDPEVRAPNVIPDLPAQPSLPSPQLPNIIPAQVSPLPPQDSNNIGVTSSGNSMRLEPAQISKAQKYCKFAASALNYDDIPEAINNLQKALRLLQTGQDN